ncbi:MAG TPA: hypothetical protein VI758_10895 [Bacteroidota bacterium]
MRSYTSMSIVLAAALMFCCKDSATGPQFQPLSKIYFETEYVNFSWGYVHNGWFIDTAGNVISYDLAKSGTQWVPNSNELYGEAELWAKIHHNDTLRTQVPLDTLEALRSLAVASVGGKYSDTTCPGADMGAFVYACYVYQADSLKFRRTVLRVYGDCRYYNTSPSAIELADWMASR